MHFLLLGAGLFVAFGFVSKRTGTAPEKIVVTRGQIESLALSFTRTWQRPPTDEELAGLIRDHVREEVYYRDAIALGLDRDDTSSADGSGRRWSSSPKTSARRLGRPTRT